MGKALFFSNVFKRLISSFSLLLLCSVLLFAQGNDQPRTSAKLLTVGNSFADNITTYISEFAKAGNKQLVYFGANLGGHSFEQHMSYVDAFEANSADPKGHAYKNRKDPKTGEKKDFSLKEALQSETWDFVTVQQHSIKSFKPETFQPFADNLIVYIRKNAPQAEILVHETWAYREDHPLFKDGTVTQKSMYEGLKAAYENLATAHKLRMIPVGDAFQLARATPRWTFSYPDPNFDYKNPPQGVIPKQPGSLNKGWLWNKDKQGQEKFNLDAIHANQDGCFLGGAVLYEILYNEDVEKNTFIPQGMTEEDAKALRHIAHEAVRARKNK